MGVDRSPVKRRSSQAGSQTGKAEHLIKQPVQAQELQNNKVMNNSKQKRNILLRWPTLQKHIH